MKPSPDVHRLIYLVLRVGILLSVVMVLIGLAAMAVTAEAFPTRPVPFDALPSELAHVTAAGLLSLGVMLMILTPVARVFLTIVVFADERDWVYVLVTGLVFVNLLVGVALALA